jgi:hypothetical protein
MRALSGWWFVLALTLLCGTAGAADLLSEADSQLLTTNLQTLSRGWVQSAVDASSPVFWKSEYNRNAWVKFFTAIP